MMPFFVTAVAAFLASSIASAKKCSDVYPHLSCGLRNERQSTCLEAGCCWDAELSTCFAPAIFGYEYNVVTDEAGHQEGTLSLNEPSGIAFGADYKELDISFTQETEARTHIKISVPNIQSWEVPEFLIQRPGGLYSGEDALTKTIVKAQNDDDAYDNMEIFITRMADQKPTGEFIFVFTKMLVFQEQYLQFVLGSPGDVVATYGFGESSRLVQHLEANTTYTLWNTDMPASNFEHDLYGSHPFFIQVSSSGKAHGVLFLNSNAMDVTMTESSTQGNTIGVQSTGGLIDLYIFAGPTPEDVVKQYLEVVGRPAMVPFWSLGFHNCRWGYPDVVYIQDVVKNYSDAKIPLETQWVDIDYMDAYKDFTLNPISFGDTAELVKQLHESNQRFVPIIDPAIFSQDPDYSSYTDGLEMDIFVKDLYGTEPYLGQVWPGPTYFPDWFASNTTIYWQEQLAQFYQLVNFDGIWIDMNEVSNFCNYGGAGQICYTRDKAQCKSNACCLHCTTVDRDNKYDFPPFIPHTVMRTLGGRTLAMSAVHSGNIPEYNAHNLHGMMESRATQSAVTNILNERPFVLSRSTFLGSGKYAAHWTGDNAATWDDLRASIVTMNNMALFGIPMIGADICGFQDNTTEELCGRWIQVGAFSPFSRSHNIRKVVPQELYRWESVAEISRSVLKLRYELLPYLYTLMYNAHAYGRTVHNAMWMHFASDGNAFFQDKQYMWSDGILFTPVLSQGASVVTGYFPQGLWYSLFDDTFIDSSDGGKFVSIETPFDKTNVHVRGGTVIPKQDFAMTTSALRKSPFSLLLALDTNGEASGELFLDDGVQIDIYLSSVISYEVADNILVSKVSTNTYESDVELRSIKIVGKLNGLEGEDISCKASVVVAGETVREMTSTRATYGDLYSIVFQLDAQDTRPIKTVSNFVMTWTC